MRPAWLLRSGFGGANQAEPAFPSACKAWPSLDKPHVKSANERYRNRPAASGREKQARRSYTGPGGSWRRFRSDQTPRASSGNHKQTNSGWTDQKTRDVGRSSQTYCGSNAETLGGRKEVREEEALRRSIIEPGHEKICSSRLTSVGLFFCRYSSATCLAYYSASLPCSAYVLLHSLPVIKTGGQRSEERRVGKECA